MTIPHPLRVIKGIKEGRTLFLLLVLVPAIPLAYLVLRSVAGERKNIGQQIAGYLEGVSVAFSQQVAGSIGNCEGDFGRRLGSGMAFSELIAALASRPSTCGLIQDYCLLDSGLRILFPFGPPELILSDVTALAPPAGRPPRCLPALEKGSQLEFAAQDPDRAIAEYRQALAVSEDDVSRALSLLSLARCSFKRGEYQDTQTYYQEMLRRGAVSLSLGGLSLELLARYQLAVLEEVLEGKGKALEKFFAIAQELAQGRLAGSLEEASFYVFRIEKVLAGLTEDEAARSAFGKIRERFRHRAALRQRMERLLSRDRRQFLQFGQWAMESAGGMKVISVPGEGGGDYVLCRRLDVPGRESPLLLAALLDARALREEIKSIASAARQVGKDVNIMVVDDQGGVVAEERRMVGSSPYRLRKALAPLVPSWQVDLAYRSDGLLLKLDARERRIRFGYITFLLMIIFFGVFMVFHLAKKDAELARLKSDFVSRVSHELRTPLATVRAVGEMLEMGAVRDREKEREYFSIITSEIERLSRLIDNVLDFSKIDRDKKRYVLRPADLRQIVSAAVRTFGEFARAEGFSVHYEEEGEIPTMAIDQDAMSQALVNLMDNAVKFSREEKTIWVSLRRQKDAVIISVRDRGIGIAPPDTRRIFKEYYRLKDAREFSRKGAGIGLAIVKHVAEAHGGRIEVESAPGEGSTFSIALPIGGGSVVNVNRNP